MEKLLKVKDVQKILGCGRTKIYEIIGASGFPKIQIGKQYYIPESEFEKWLNRNLNKKVML